MATPADTTGTGTGAGTGTGTNKRQTTRTTVSNPTPTLNEASSSAATSFDTSNLQNVNNAFISRRLSFIDANGKLREIGKKKYIKLRKPLSENITHCCFILDDDDDDFDFITTDSAGRQVAFKSKESTIPIVNRATSKLSNLGSVTASGQRTVDLITFSDDSGELDDLDDFDDFGIFPSVNTVPFVSRQNAVRVVSPQTSIFNPVIRAPVRQTKKKSKFVQVDQNGFRAPATTCTCPPQRETITRFQPAVTPTSQFWQLMRFPQQQSFNRFVQPNNFASWSQFPGVQFVFDD